MTSSADARPRQREVGQDRIADVIAPSLAILFTACPSKSLRSEHRKAIALQAAKGLRIVPFGMKQVGQIEGEEIF